MLILSLWRGFPLYRIQTRNPPFRCGIHGGNMEGKETVLAYLVRV